MKWNKLTIETTTAAEDMLSYELSEMGMEGVEIEDHVPLSEEDRKIMYVDLLPDEIAPDDGKARISCYVDEKEDLQAVIAKIKAKIENPNATLESISLELFSSTPQPSSFFFFTLFISPLLNWCQTHFL